jgi:hypothetical protein
LSSSLKIFRILDTPSSPFKLRHKKYFSVVPVYPNIYPRRKILRPIKAKPQDTIMSHWSVNTGIQGVPKKPKTIEITNNNLIVRI